MRTRTRQNDGYALISVLAIAFILCLFVTMIFRNNYSLHRHNLRYKARLQDTYDALSK